MKCLNINNLQIQSELNKLTEILGDANAAYAVLALNNGYGLEKASNGQTSKLFLDLYETIKTQYPEMTEEEAYKKVFVEKAKCYSPNFLDWFGDWVNNPDNASKVVDENGEPLVVYHGSRSEVPFNEFSYDYLKADDGFYFTSGKKYMQLYNQNDITFATFLNIRNPRYMDNIIHDSVRQAFSTEFDSKNPIDGIIGHDRRTNEFEQSIGEEHTEYVVMRPNQIKAVIGNNGKYEGNNIYGEHEYKKINQQRDSRLLSLYDETKELSFENKWVRIINEIINPSPYKDVADLLASFSSKENKFLSKINIELVDHFKYTGNRAIESRERFQNKRAYYDASDSTIYIDIYAPYNNGDSASVLMHEIMHGITVSRIIDNNELRDKFSKILTQFKKYNPGYYLSIKEHILEEFIADIWSNPEIIERLKNTPATKNAKTSLWEKIVKFFQSVLFNDVSEGSLFQEASALMIELLESNPTEKKLEGNYYENFGLSQDTKDILSLQQYQYSIEGLTPEEIQERQRAYLSQDPAEVQRVRKFLELIQVRQAQLHTFNKDFGEEQYINGIFDWNNYLLGVDLRKDITDNQDLSTFSPIVDYKVDPAEIIMPKLYKTQFKLGTKDIADIDLNFFKRANPFYKSDLKSEGIPVDYLVRGHNFAYNIVVQDALQFDHVNWKPITPRIEDGWRLDNSGNRMYQIPADCKYALYINPKGQETLVILNEGLSDNYIKTIIETTNNRVSVHPFFENFTPIKNKLLDVIKWNHITTINGALKNLSRQVDQIGEDQIREALNDLYIKRERQYKNDLANTLYNSFIKTLYLVSVRIPTQDFQSIMATKVVGLTNDDSNNVFVTRWQFWLQGSDLDIDKTYLMGADISSIGTYNHWSPLADYTSPELAKLSDELPLPNGKVILAPNETYKAQGDYITIEFADVQDNPIDIALWNTYDDDETNYKKLRLETVTALLKEINKTGRFIMSEQLYQDPQIKHIIDLINKHNTHNITAAESRNIIQSLILKASLDERNMRASYSPIDVVMDKFKNVLNQVEDSSKSYKSLDDGGRSIAMMQYNNSVGKKDVGIMANCLKAFFALTQYFNQHKNDPQFVNSNRYFLSKISLGQGQDKYFSTISDVKFEEYGLQALKQAFQTFLPDVALTTDLTFNADDASLLISSLVSLATDNAKELALAKMNASIDLACIHLFLVVMGYDPKEIVTFTTSPVFKRVINSLNKSALLGEKVSVRTAIKLVKSQNLTPEELYQLEQMEYIYNCAQEMSKVAKLAGINQGVKVDELETDKFFNTIQSVIEDQVKPLTSQEIGGLSIKMSGYDISIILNPDSSGQVDGHPIQELIYKTHNYHPNSITHQTLLQSYQSKLDDLNIRNNKYHYMLNDFQIDMFRFYNDSEYKQFVIDLYDLFKHNFNILDCFSNLPHFNKMLQAFVLSETTILKQSSRARAVLKDSKKAYKAKNIYNKKVITDANLDSGEDTSREVKAFDFQQFGTQIQQKAGRFYDDFILSEFLLEQGKNFNIEFTLGSEKTKINLESNEGIGKFTQFIAFDLIPLLKEILPTNRFLQHIRPDFKRLRRGVETDYLPKYKFNFDVDTLSSTSDQNKAFYINSGFAKLGVLTLEDVQNLAIKKIEDFDLQFTSGQKIPVGELLYLYDKFCTTSSVGVQSLDKAFELYLTTQFDQKIPTVAYQIAKIIQDHDNGTRQDIPFNSNLFTAYCYANQIKKEQSGYASFKDSEEIIDLNGKYLFNLQEVKQVKDSQLLLEKLILKLKQSEIIPKLDGKMYTLLTSSGTPIVSIPTTDTELTLFSLFNSLIEFIKVSPDGINTLKAYLEKPTKPTMQLKSYNTVKVYKVFQERMAQLGVSVEITVSADGVNGYVQNGVIHLNPTSDITTTPMHELMHLVFAVMKEDDYSNFERTVKLASRSEKAQELITQLESNPEYANLMESDLLEEVVCRMLESVVNKQLTVEEAFNINGQDAYIAISKSITPFVVKTFGIDGSIELLPFLSDSIAALPGYGSTLFMKPKADSTGYLEQQDKVIKNIQLSKYIASLIQSGYLKETEC